MQKNINQSEMAESGGFKQVTQVAMHVAAAVIKVLKDADVGPQPSNIASLREPQRQGYSRPALEKPSFNWNFKDRYINSLNFEMEVMKILETKTYE